MMEGNAYEALAEESKKALMPWDGTLELTYRCNERCAMCYLGPDWGKGRKKDELTTAEVFDLLDQIYDGGCFELLLTGGEVLLRKDFVEILDYAGRKGFFIYVKTNGTLVSAEIAAAIRRNPVNAVNMSLLGSNAATHDAITRIPGSFDRTIRAIGIFRSVGQPVQLNFTALKLNFKEVVDSRRLAESLDCAFKWEAEIIPRDDRSVIPLTMRLPNNEMAKMQALHVSEKIEQEGEVPMSGYENNTWFCQAGWSSFNVNPYGDVQPCSTMRMDCGNIREKSFMEIWENAPEFRRLRALRISEVYGCNRCEIRSYCHACPGLNFMEMGDVTIPSPHTCEMTEMRHEAATGIYKPAGSRDSAGEFPRPANAILGAYGEPHVVKLAPRGEA